VEGGQDDRVGCQVSASCPSVSLFPHPPPGESDCVVCLPKPSVERIHLLKRMTDELKLIQTLRRSALAGRTARAVGVAARKAIARGCRRRRVSTYVT
jgi:hypothetical protein